MVHGHASHRCERIGNRSAQAYFLGISKSMTVDGRYPPIWNIEITQSAPSSAAGRSVVISMIGYAPQPLQAVRHIPGGVQALSSISCKAIVEWASSGKPGYRRADSWQIPCSCADKDDPGHETPRYDVGYPSIDLERRRRGATAHMRLMRASFPGVFVVKFSSV